MQDNDARDRELLGALQGDVPLVSTPFAVIGQQIDMSEKEVIKRSEKLKREGIVRQIAANFDLRALGYRSSLVAARVKEERIDDAAAIINAHPGVTQNYKRNNDFNLWFTVAVAPSSKLGLERTIEVLAEEAEFDVVRPLPTLKLYKSSSADGHETHANESDPHTDFTQFTPMEVETIRLLQRAEQAPFAAGLVIVTHPIVMAIPRGSVSKKRISSPENAEIVCRRGLARDSIANC